MDNQVRKDVALRDELNMLSLPDGWIVIHVHQHRVHSQLVIGFPNGYALSIVRGNGTYGYEDGLFEIAYSAYDKSTVGLDEIKWEVVGYHYATTVLMQSDSVSGWLSAHDVFVVA